MEGDFASIEAVEPDVEVSVTSGGETIAIFGVFQNKSDVWDVLVGVDDTERIDQLLTLLEALVSSLQVATFAPVSAAGVRQLSFLDDEPPKGYYNHEKGEK